MSFEILATVFDPSVLLLTVIGVSLGIVFGAIPGISATTGVALVLPVTFQMGPINAIFLMIGVFFGGMSGGLIPSILLKIPGTPAALATTFDGYPMAQKGQAGRALGIGILASFFGGIFSSVCLLAFSPLLSRFALSFGPFEYFGVCFFAMMCVVALLDRGILRGFVSLGIGVAMSFVGSSPIDGVRRFTMGLPAMSGGFQLMSIIIGMFAISEMFNSVDMIGKEKPEITEKIDMRNFFPAMREWRESLRTLLLSSTIGTVAGILPGLGGGAGSMISYVQCKKWSRKSAQYGTGCMDGLIASEAANNAVTGGAMIPLLSLGVPGDSATALILGGMAVQGINIGPALFKTRPELMTTIITYTFVANIVMVVVAVLALNVFIHVIKTPRYYLFPVIVMFCVIGVFSVNNRTFDVILMLLCAYLGYALDKNGYSVAPLMLGFILGTLTEQYYRRAMIYYGSFGGAMSESVVGTLFFIAGVLYPTFTLLMQSNRVRRTLGLKPHGSS